ncbi:MAG: hypothetical protein JW880_03845 [Candidatus Thermoplasmatota archaeon]|nr:hypothetical protein [Candidatus Thermoplasmatota archaeon]
MASLTVESLRGDLEPFESELMEEFYRNYAGLKEDMSTAAIYSKYSHLFSAESVGEVSSAAEAAGAEGSEDFRWLSYLRSFSTNGYMDNLVKDLTDTAQTFEAQSLVQFDGEQVPYRMVPVRLRNEADADRRRRLFEAKLGETEKLNALLLERMEKLHSLSKTLGFKNYCDLCSSLKGIDYRALESHMQELIRKTDELYAREMEQLLRSRAGLSLTDAWSYDIPFAFRGEEYDKYFEKDRLTEAFFRTLRGMGLDPEKYSNIEVDMEERPKKSPRAFCAPIKVPRRIKLVIMPSGGWRDYESFFHEGGHAWHFGNTREDLPAEYRYLGDNSVTESFAFLFEYLTSNPLWLREVLGMEEPAVYVRFALVNKLMFLRRYGSKLIYELKLHNAHVTPEFQDVYRTTLQKSLRFRHSEKHYLEDVDDAFYCAEYLRAWILEAQVRAALQERFGEAWFKNDKAGGYLKELWSYGQKFTANEMVKTVGYADLDIEPLAREIELGLADQS